MLQSMYFWIVLAVIVGVVLIGLMVMLAGGRGRRDGRSRRPDLEPPAEEERPALTTKPVTPLRDRPRKAVTTTRPKQPTRPTDGAPADARRPSQPVPPMRREVDRAGDDRTADDRTVDRAGEPGSAAPSASAAGPAVAEPEELIRPTDAAPPPDAPTAEEHAARTDGQPLTAENRLTSAEIENRAAGTGADPVGVDTGGVGASAPTVDRVQVDDPAATPAGAAEQPVDTLTPDEVSDQRERVRHEPETAAPPVEAPASRPLPDVDRAARTDEDVLVERDGTTPEAPAGRPLPDVDRAVRTDEEVLVDDDRTQPGTDRTVTDRTVTDRTVTDRTVTDRDGTDLADTEVITTPAAPAEVHEKPKVGDRVGRMQKLFGEYIPGIRRRKVDEDTWEDLEEALLRCDVGVPYTTKLLHGLRERAEAQGVTDGQELIDMLAQRIKDNMAHADRGLYLDPDSTNVWLVVGVNGTGKTTTIGKLGRSISDEGHRVLFAAGDTFRAAAADQLQVWAERVGADIVRGAEGADPSSIIFDAIERANARGYQLVLADTAGRLHTKANLMEELRKIRRVANKAKGEVTEVLLVLDATTGQNGLNQAKQFTDAVELTGVVLTKLDGTAKGGIALSIQDELGIPVKLIGLGEQADDLIPFEPDDFVDALLGA